MEILQVRLNPDSFVDNPLAVKYGLPGRFFSSSSTNSVQVTVTEIPGYNYCGMVLQGYHAIAPTTPPHSFVDSQQALLEATSLIRPAPQLGAHAILQGVTVSTQQGTTLAVDNLYPQTVVLQNDQLLGQSNFDRDMGNDISFLEFGAPHLHNNTLAQALTPFCFQPRLSIPQVIDMSVTGPLVFQFTLATPPQTCMFPSGAFPSEAGTSEGSALSIPVPAGLYQGSYGNNTFEFPVQMDTVNRDLANYTILTTIQFIAFYKRSAEGSASMSFLRKVVNPYRLPVQANLTQSWSLPLMGVCASDIQTRIQDQRLLSYPCYNRWSFLCTAGTSVQYTIQGLQTFITYPTDSVQQDTQLTSTLSTAEMQLLEYSTSEHNTLVNRSHGRYERLYFAPQWGFNNTRIYYQKNLGLFNTRYLSLASVQLNPFSTPPMNQPVKYGQQEVATKYAFAGTTPSVIPVSGIVVNIALTTSPLDFQLTFFNVANLPLPTWTAGRARIGQAISYLYGPNGPNTGGLWTGAAIVWQAIPLYAPLVYPIKLAWDYQSMYNLLTVNTYRQTTIATNGVTTAPAPSSSSSTSYAYDFNHGGAPGVSSSQLIRQVPGVQVPSYFAGNIAWEFMLPDSGMIISAYLQTTVSPVPERNPPNSLAPLNIPEPSPYMTTMPATSLLGIACGRVCPSHIGQASFVRAVTFYDGAASVPDFSTALARSIEMHGWTHDDHVLYHALAQGGEIFSKRPRSYGALHSLQDESLRYDTICHPRDAVFKWPGYSDYASNPFTVGGQRLFRQDLYSSAKNINLLWVNLRSASNLWDQLANVPLQPNRRIRIELSQQGTWIGTRSAGGGALSAMQRDPFQEARLAPLFSQPWSGTQTVTPAADLPFNRIQPAIHYGATMGQSPILFLRLGFMPNQTEYAQRIYAEAPPEIVLPKTMTFADYYNLENLPATWTAPIPNCSFKKTGLNSTMFAPQQYAIGSIPEAVIVQTIAGYKDPTDQRADILPTVLPWNSYGRGFYGYSLSLFSTKVVPDRPTYTDCMAPYMQPLVDGASLRTTLPNFGDYMNNIFEYHSITGTRLRAPYASVVPLPPPYIDFEPPFFSAIKSVHYQATTGKLIADSAPTGGAIVSINLRGNAALEVPMYSITRFPACNEFIFLELGDRVKGRELLTLNWQFNQSPLTNTTTGMDRYFVGWAASPMPLLTLAADFGSTAATTNLTPFRMLGAGLQYACPNQYTQLVHFYSHETFRIGLDGIVRVEAAF